MPFFQIAFQASLCRETVSSVYLVMLYLTILELNKKTHYFLALPSIFGVVSVRLRTRNV